MEIISDAQEIRTRLEQFQATKDPKLKTQCRYRRCAGSLD